MLPLDELREYNHWVGKSALHIRLAAIANGGWGRVFSKGKEPFPMWASRVRNYFNERPRRLMLLNPGKAGEAWRRQKFSSGTPFLSPVVYEDENGRHWFQMRAAGAVYHYEGSVSDSKGYKFWEAIALGQKATPVFKLISPDGTGGSCELCVHNWQHHQGKGEIGPEGKWVDIQARTVLNDLYKGSYNYSETAVVGLGAHNFRDVFSHSTEGGFYLNAKYSLPQMSRLFERNDPRGRSIEASDTMMRVKH